MTRESLISRNRGDSVVMEADEAAERKAQIRRQRMDTILQSLRDATSEAGDTIKRDVLGRARPFSIVVQPWWSLGDYQ